MAVNGLQWGRVLMNAETGAIVHERISDMRASMGPRSHERGNQFVHDDFRGGQKASMGPRSHERGNSLILRRPALLKRFNGAAFS